MTQVPNDPAAQPSGPMVEMEPTPTPVHGQESDPDHGSGPGGEDSAKDLPNSAPTGPVAAAKKKKKKKKGKKGKTKPTGFEEYYADAPMTPQEAAEEREELYHPDKSFVERIETCLHRFRNKRRIQGNTIGYFNEYLFLGGIDCRQRAFQGIDSLDLEDATTAEKRDITGIETIHGGSGGAVYYNSHFPEHWDVDFAGIVAGYLSTSVPRLTWGRGKEVAQAIGVVANFLRYLQMHEVCPEYDEDISRAIELCKSGEEEMHLVNKIPLLFPGQFNLACQELYLKEQTFFVYSSLIFERPENFDARSLLAAVVVFMGDSELHKKAASLEALHVVNEERYDLEVVSIHRPDAKLCDTFQRIKPRSGPAHFLPIGRVTCKHIRIEDDIDRGEYRRPIPLDGEETLFLDDAILAQLKPGMKFRGTLCTLNAGIKFFKDSPQVLPTYYTFLPQNMMRHYKEPVPNDRPAPSANDPFSEDDVADFGGGGDGKDGGEEET